MQLHFEGIGEAKMLVSALARLSVSHVTLWFRIEFFTNNSETFERQGISHLKFLSV